MSLPLSRPRALALIALIWAGIYLPALGTLEIKGEEGRRILPGVTMLATGRWIVPSIGGVDYFSKPPLVNWAIAGAIRLRGQPDEWAARAPSVLSVLALGAGTVWFLTDWLGAGGAFLAAVFMLTGIGLMEKGRLAEIEAMYVSWFGLALVAWLRLWQRANTAKARWLAWTLPWFFLGFGLLTKGPLHVVFFYAIVIGILLVAARLRDLWSWPHLAGVALMLAIFGAWAVPYLHLTAAERVGQVWSNQLADRLEVDEAFRAGKWALNIPRGLVNFVPWVVLLPLLWWRRRASVAGDDDPAAALDFAILRGGRWAMAACFLAVSLAPGGVPRYTLPLLVPASVLLALVCVREKVFGGPPGWLPVVWARVLLALLASSGLGAAVAAQAGGGGWRWLAAICLMAASVWLIGRLWRRLSAGAGEADLVQLGFMSGAVMAMLTMEYALGAVPRMLAAERLRPLAGQVNALVAQAPPLYVYQPGYLPFCFYMRPPVEYTQSIANLPPSARYLLVNAQDMALVEKQLASRGIAAQPAFTLDRLLRGTWYVLSLPPRG